MKLYYKSKEEKYVELEEVQSIGEGDIVIRSKVHISREDTEELEAYLSERFKRNVIILDAKYGDILIIPPKK